MSVNLCIRRVVPSRVRLSTGEYTPASCLVQKEARISVRGVGRGEEGAVACASLCINGKACSSRVSIREGTQRTNET